MSNMRGYTAAVIFILVILITAHSIAPVAYDFTEHTISQLAAQRYAKGWVMRIGMLGFGILLLLAARRKFMADGTRRWTEGPLVICGSLFVLSAFFSTRPFQSGVPYSEFEAVLHGVASTSARIMVILSMLAYAFQAGEQKRRLVHFITFALVIGLNFMLEARGFREGIVQRVLCGVVLTWLVFIDTSGIHPVGQEKEKLAA